MTYCKISLHEVGAAAKYPDYRDRDFVRLFGSLRVRPRLSLTRQAFQQESVRHTRGMSISGVQQKLSMAIDTEHQLVPVTRDGRFILKPSPEQYPHAAENEHAAMLTGKALGIRTAECGLISFADGDLAYITRRFDRTGTGDKLHQEDLVQGFAMPIDSKYRHSYEEAGTLIRKMTDGLQVVVLDYLKRVMHAYLVGNDDLHLKNLSLQKDPGNSTPYYDRLTPNYDCLFADSFENRSDVGYLAIDLLADGFSDTYEKYGYYTGHDFIELARRLDIPDKPVLSFIEEIEHKLPDLLSIIERSYMPAAMQQAAASTVSDRLGMLRILP